MEAECIQKTPVPIHAVIQPVIRNRVQRAIQGSLTVELIYVAMIFIALAQAQKALIRKWSQAIQDLEAKRLVYDGEQP